MPSETEIEKIDFSKVICPGCTAIVYLETMDVFGNRCPHCGEKLDREKLHVIRPGTKENENMIGGILNALHD